MIHLGNQHVNVPVGCQSKNSGMNQMKRKSDVEMAGIIEINNNNNNNLNSKKVKLEVGQTGQSHQGCEYNQRKEFVVNAVFPCLNTLDVSVCEGESKNTCSYKVYEQTLYEISKQIDDKVFPFVSFKRMLTHSILFCPTCRQTSSDNILKKTRVLNLISLPCLHVRH